MFQLGKKQSLFIVKELDFGVYLGEEPNAPLEDRVLLPKKQVPKNCRIGNRIEVFLYKDSKDRIIATTNEPLLCVGEVGKLKVSQVTKIGAFLDWGLEKDILLPYKEQTSRVREGDEVLAAIYVDKSSRLAATMKVYKYLHLNSDYEKDDMVRGTVYEIHEEFGAFVAVDDRFSALIPKKELYGDIKVGDVVTARVTDIKEDGKLDLSVREKAYIQIEKDVVKLVKIMESFDGVLPFNDKSAPEVIKRETGMSKNEFKRAVGNLLKNGKITIQPDCIRLKKS
ncbi:MAG: S1 RNA-binding domain-containing protein [Lachnospiraceae bacterium]|nr:S1 RNA-binding domain-containing protein [Lachnospiraceae bacterium]MBO5144576.1 S1 RNA-binding domain-containing protein [Lachnospiraceae bacterium]